MKKIDSDGSDYSDEEVYLLKKDEDFYPVRGQPGLWYKVSGYQIGWSMCVFFSSQEIEVVKYYILVDYPTNAGHIPLKAFFLRF